MVRRLWRNDRSRGVGQTVTAGGSALLLTALFLMALQVVLLQVVLLQVVALRRRAARCLLVCRVLASR